MRVPRTRRGPVKSAALQVNRCVERPVGDAINVPGEVHEGWLLKMGNFYRLKLKLDQPACHASPWINKRREYCINDGNESGGQDNLMSYHGHVQLFVPSFYGSRGSITNHLICGQR